MRIRFRASVIFLTLVAACGGSDRAAGPRVGSLVVSVTGLDGGPAASVAVSGPAGFAQTLTATTTLSALAPGSYTVVASNVASATTRWTPAPATQTIAVEASTTPATATVAYAIATSRLAVTVSGLPAGVAAAYTVTGPGGFSRAGTAGAAYDLLDPGAYTVTAASVTSNGTVYRPTIASQPVTLGPSATATTVAVTYAVGSGSLTVDVVGLPGGLAPALAVRGPNGFAQNFTAATTLVALDPGVYLVAAAPRTTADGQAIYSVLDTLRVTVTAGATGVATVTYAPFDLAYQTVATGLTSPTYLTAPAGDARLFVVEQPGRVRVIKGGQLLATPFLDISGRISYGGERGLLSLAFDPSYATNGNFFVYFTNPDGDIAVERYTSAPGSDVANATPTPVIVIPHRENGNHNGGLVTFGPDGMLYLATGDGGGGGDQPGNAQNTSVLLGKLLRLDVHTLPYTIPSTNPFVGQSGKRGEIWAYGLRNPWRYDWDATSENLYIADVGQDRYEEIDVTPATLAGVNYGWNTMEATHCYQPVSGCNTSGLRLPVAEYDHGKGCSITGGFVYRGVTLPEIAGYFFYSDYCSGFLASLAATNATSYVTRPWSVTGADNVLSFGEDGVGELYVLSASGSVRKLVRR